MRWLSFAILAYVTVAIHLALGGFVNWGNVAPNLVLPSVVFIAINARREEALIGVLILGLAQDLFTQTPMGLYAFSYALVGLFAVGTSQSVHRDHPLTHFFVTLSSALATNALIFLNEWLHPLLHHTDRVQRPSLWLAFAGAFYTALIGVVVIALLTRGKRLFAFKNSRSVAAGRWSGAMR